MGGAESEEFPGEQQDGSPVRPLPPHHYLSLWGEENYSDGNHADGGDSWL